MSRSEELLAASQVIKAEADVLLYERGLMDVLSKYGTVVPTGSYYMDLMTWRDLDLYLDMAAFDKGRMYELVHELSVMLQPFWLEAKSMLENPEPDFPRGYFIGVEGRLLGPDVWNIDIIAMSAADIARSQAEVDERQRAIPPDLAPLVLELKNLPGHLDTFQSIDVYNGVIHHGVRSVDEFQRWLPTQ